MIQISIILVNYKNRKLTEDCIISILKSASTIKYEIIVVDNHSEDGSEEYLREKYPSVLVLGSEKNGGFAYGNNIGAKIAKGDYLLLLNNDTVIYKGMLENLIDTAQKNKNIGLLGCRSVDKNGIELSVAHSYENLRRLNMQTFIKPIMEKIGLQRKLAMYAENNKMDNSNFIRAEWIAGSALFIDRKLYFNIGGLDENYFMYMEDEDLGRRINDAGYLVGITNYVGYVHYCGGSTIKSYFLTKEYFKSRLLFFYRYERNNFRKIKKVLYKQIRVINSGLSKAEIDQMKEELDLFVESELDFLSGNIMGITPERKLLD